MNKKELIKKKRKRTRTANSANKYSDKLSLINNLQNNLYNDSEEIHQILNNPSAFDDLVNAIIKGIKEELKIMMDIKKGKNYTKDKKKPKKGKYDKDAKKVLGSVKGLKFLTNDKEVKKVITSIKMSLYHKVKSGDMKSDDAIKQLFVDTIIPLHDEKLVDISDVEILK